MTNYEEMMRAVKDGCLKDMSPDEKRKWMLKFQEAHIAHITTKLCNGEYEMKELGVESVSLFTGKVKTLTNSDKEKFKRTVREKNLTDECVIQYVEQENKDGH